MDKTELIELVRNQRPLWDPAHKYYRNRELKPSLWDNISKKLKVTRRQAQRTWESLRDVYRRNLRELTERRTRTRGQPIRKWKYFDMMDFLRVALNVRNLKLQNIGTRSSYSNSEEVTYFEEIVTFEPRTENLKQEDQDDDDILEALVNDESGSDIAYKKSEELVEPQRTTRKLMENEPKEHVHRTKHILKTRSKFEDTKSSKSDDEDYLFLKSLLPSIKKLDEVEKMHLKMEFLAALTKKHEERRKSSEMISSEKFQSTSRDTPSAVSHSSVASPPEMNVEEDNWNPTDNTNNSDSMSSN